MHQEGGLEKPTRLPINWQEEAFYDQDAIEKEMERVFDICHSCRRCFNLCDSFPILFDLIDNSPTQEVDGVAKKDYQKVVDACTLCDMCYMTKCPYVPPHPFAIDFPNLMLRYRASKAQKKPSIGLWRQHQLSYVDRNQKIFGYFYKIINWMNDTKNKAGRWILKKIVGIHEKVQIPLIRTPPLHQLAQKSLTPLVPLNQHAPSLGKKAILLFNCYPNYHQPSIAYNAMRVLAHNGIDITPYYPKCCGMPLWEQGQLKEVAAIALDTVESIQTMMEKDIDIISIVPSCTFMMKHLWPLLHPTNEAIKNIAQRVIDINDYVVQLAKKDGLAPGLEPIIGGITVHLACHDRAQNIGPKAAQMLKLIPETTVHTIERCSGHGGSWGLMNDHFDQAQKISTPVRQAIAKQKSTHVASTCPLAAKHLFQMDEKNHASSSSCCQKNQKNGSSSGGGCGTSGGGCGTNPGGESPDQFHRIENGAVVQTFYHPIEIMAKSYGMFKEGMDEG
jgi:glycerol-3-phosphate dehydrogenase subunit C